MEQPSTVSEQPETGSTSLLSLLGGTRSQALALLFAALLAYTGCRKCGEPTPTGPTSSDPARTCGISCTTDTQCQSAAGLKCFILEGATTGTCRNAFCPTDGDCNCGSNPSSFPGGGSGSCK